MHTKSHPLFQSRLAWQTFWALLLGIIFLCAAGMSVFGTYLIYGRDRVSHLYMVNEIIRDVTVMKSVSASKLSDVMHDLRRPGVRVNVASQPEQGADVLQSADAKFLRTYLDQRHRVVRVSIPLENGRWLNIHAFRREHPWFLLGFIISSATLLIGLTLLCLWAVRRLGVPMQAFTEAAKRFGVDVESPPLALTGPPEIQEVIQAFNEMQARIRRLLHDRTQMLAAISHDLRTPITRLQLRAEYLKDTNQYERAVKDLAEMEQMISSILSFARDYVRSEPMEWFDLNALLESLCDDMVDVGHCVRYENDANRLPYFGRMSALKRALSNLIENAVKYGKEAEVVLKQGEQSVQVKVSDQGPGIPPDQFEKVFAPFYRIDQSRSPKTSGTGLGLAVARDIIRAHGGEITLLNRDPKGLTVIVTLPLQHDKRVVD